MISPGRTTYYTGSTTTGESAIKIAWAMTCPGWPKECHLSHECRYKNGLYNK